jgi:hypothetical protein
MARGRGTDPPDDGKHSPPKHENHVHYFELALEEALKDWNGTMNETLPVTRRTALAGSFSATPSSPPSPARTCCPAGSELSLPPQRLVKSRCEWMGKVMWRPWRNTVTAASR